MEMMQGMMSYSTTSDDSSWTQFWLEDAPHSISNKSNSPSNTAYELPSQLQAPNQLASPPMSSPTTTTVTNYSTKEERKINSFILNLYTMLEDPSCHTIIFWLPNEKEFGFNVSAESAGVVLNKYYKLQQVTSFVRQLNMYGFIKLQKQPCYVYQHPYFQKGRTDLLHLVKRNLSPFLASPLSPLLSYSTPLQPQKKRAQSQQEQQQQQKDHEYHHPQQPSQEMHVLVQRVQVLEDHLQIYHHQLQYQVSLLEALLKQT